jgi:hypothetical protein
MRRDEEPTSGSGQLTLFAGIHQPAGPHPAVDSAEHIRREVQRRRQDARIDSILNSCCSLCAQRLIEELFW